jgi:ankyrin repeat protein
MANMRHAIPPWHTISDDCVTTVIERSEADQTLGQLLPENVITSAPHLPTVLKASPFTVDVRHFEHLHQLRACVDSLRQGDRIVEAKNAARVFRQYGSFSSPTGFTNVHAAVFNGCIDLIPMLAIFNKAIINQPNNKGWTPLHEAAFGGKINFAEALMKANGASSLDKCAVLESFQLTPLMVSVMKNDIKMVKFLLSHKADPWIKDVANGGMTATHYAVRFARSVPILQALLLAQFEAQRSFDFPLSSVSTKNLDVSTPLHLAMSRSDIRAMNTILVFGGADETDGNGMTALHFAWRHIHFRQPAQTDTAFQVQLAAGALERHLILAHGATAEILDNLGLNPSRHAFLAYLIPKLNGVRPKFGSPLYSWAGARTTCSNAWHTTR